MFKVWCNIRGESSWATNALEFPTAEQAQAFAEGLFLRWTMLQQWEVRDEAGTVHLRGPVGMMVAG